MSVRPTSSRRRRLSRGTLHGLLLVSVVLSVSCRGLVREGRSPSLVIIDGLEGASGAEPDNFGGTLASDVVTLVRGAGSELIPTVFEDLGRVTMRLALRDVGPPASPNVPTTNNHVTFTRYRVVFRRSDGRNQQGMDVPYAFDGAVSFTVPDGQVTAGFTLVRAQAKLEPPLLALGTGGAVIISTIAEITFFGRDQTGAEVTATGSISVNFANWGDPDS